MPDVFIIVVILLLAAVVAYLLYERFRLKAYKTESNLYVDALRDLLDQRSEAAFAKLRQVVATDPDNLDAYLRLGRILRLNKQPQRAVRVHKDLTLRGNLSKPDKVRILRELALDYRALNDDATAEKAYREWRTLAPKDRAATAGLLRLLEDRGEWDAAGQLAEELLKLDQSKTKKPLGKYRLKLAESLFSQREFHKARVAAKEALGFDPQLAAAYLLVGDAYMAEERLDDAVNFWTKLIDALPAQGHLVIERLRKTLFDLGRYGDIATVCERILEHDPANALARRTLAGFHERKGDLSTAIEQLEEIVADTPDDHLSMCELARLYLEKGDRAKIERLTRQLAGRSGGGDSLTSSEEALTQS